jgi:hypothetical protein
VSQKLGVGAASRFEGIAQNCNPRLVKNPFR